MQLTHDALRARIAELEEELARAAQRDVALHSAHVAELEEELAHARLEAESSRQVADMSRYAYPLSKYSPSGRDSRANKDKCSVRFVVP